MRTIDSVFQGSLSSLKTRCKQAILETGNQKIINRFDKLFPNLNEDGQIELTRELLKYSDVFYE